MTNEKAIMCLEDMKIKVPIPKAAKQARENNEALDVAIKALAESELGTNLAEVGTDCISRQSAIDALENDKEVLDQIIRLTSADDAQLDHYVAQHNQVVYDIDVIKQLPPIQPKRGKWILDRSGAYCCSECMEPCATYVMMKPRNKFCKMCGSRNEVTT